MNCGGFYKPFLSVHLIVSSHKFSHTPYFKENDDRKPIHNRIKKLISHGFGYRRIHKILLDEGWKIGKSPTCVYSMIKKYLRKEEFLNQEVKCVLEKVSFMVKRR